MGREEQKEEREVLDSIFPDEITDVNEQEYRLAILLDVTNEDGDDTPAPTIILQIVYPEAYPDEPPRLDIQNPPNAPKHQYLDIQEDKTRLLDALQPTIEENLGMAMVFTLVATLKDLAEQLIAERQQSVQALKEIESQKAEEEENKKFHGTAVTRESFLAWREKFMKETAEEERRLEVEREAEEKRKKAKEEKKLTGRELWERGLVGKVDDDDEEGDGMENLGVDRLKVEA
ncbi:Protein gir2 [Elasticomyces elasticus]|nr:Protein gir2 [Elasticomyces elasticus]KAK4988972.1 Protein gir2 [Elasticomyces elasticus]